MDIQAFVAKWNDCSGGAERGNAALYLVEMLTALSLPTPDPAGCDTRENDYVFERAVRSSFDHLAHPRRIDLYKRGCFVLEAKQSRWPDRAKAAPFNLSELQADMASRPGEGQRWDILMRNARKQAQSYVADLPADHPAPPFVLICDVARGFEIHADFTGTGRGFSPYPDRFTHWISHSDLIRPEIQARLRAIWTDPSSLDPSRISATITHEIVDELAVVSKRLEAVGHDPEHVALFLMRCIFTIFAADVDLLPKDRLIILLEDCVRDPPRFVTNFEALWQRLNEPDHELRFFPEFEHHLPHINGGLFKDPRVLPLDATGLDRLLLATRHDWHLVEPAIFGSLLEHALRLSERRRLGAHYTPPTFVKRLVEMTVMEPLRTDWRNVLICMELARDEGDTRGAVRLVRAFHSRLCNLRILDPACGTGNFLYVALELLKGLEGNVLEALSELGETDILSLATIDPSQFLGLEVNPRAAAIAELVLWIGWLQLHYRNHSGHPAEPILQAHGNIVRQDAVLAWDGAPSLQWRATASGAEHRIFQFLDAEILPDNTLICVAHDDAAVLAILSSRAHTVWSRARGGMLEDRPRYTKSTCFDPFPFPDWTEPQRQRLRVAGEALDAHRRAVLSDVPDMTLTGLYNLVEAVRAGHELAAGQQDVARDARVVILCELHDEIDHLTAMAYGWPAEQTDAQIRAALTGLNRVRDVEESRGLVRWLRPDFQPRRRGVRVPAPETTDDLVPQPQHGRRRPAFPLNRYEQPLAIKASFSRLDGPAEPEQLARLFSGGTRLAPRISRVLSTLHRYGHVEQLDDGRWIARP